MFSLRSSSVVTLSTAPAVVGARASSVRSEVRSIWMLALAGLVSSLIAANLVCFAPRWYSASVLSLAWHAGKMVVLSAGTGAAVVRILWGLVRTPPAAGPTRIACALGASWVFLPCIVLLYEDDSLWMLAAVGLASFAMALGVRVLLPIADITPEPYRGAAALASLDGLPPGNSPLGLSFSVGGLIYATVLMAAIGQIVLAAIAAEIAVFVITWQWSGKTSSTARFWLGPRPPLCQGAAAIVLTALCIIPFSAGGHGGMFHIGRAAGGPSGKTGRLREESSGAGYVGIILYPPPVKRRIVAPAPRTDAFRTSAHARPVMIPFDGQYWYFKAPTSRPSPRAHIARAKPTDVNVHSTDSEPLEMEAHQNLALPVDLARYGEIDLALTNADIRPGEIDIQLRLTDTAAKGVAAVFTVPQPILSTQLRHILLNRPPVQETLRFPIPPHTKLQRLNQITVIFRPSGERSRVGSKVAIEGFELVPRP